MCLCTSKQPSILLLVEHFYGQKSMNLTPDFLLTFSLTERGISQERYPRERRGIPAYIYRIYSNSSRGDY